MIDAGPKRVVTGLAIAMALGPLLVAIVVALFTNWFPASDWALIELRTRDVGSSVTPLVGPFSRFGWNHPGPLLYWVLALPYRVIGSSSNGLLLGAGLVNLASVSAMLWYAWRLGRTALLLGTAVSLSVLMAGVGGTFLVDPWNPYVVMLPLTAMVFASWALSQGHIPSLLVLVVGGSFIGQTHLGYLPLVVVLGAIGLFGYWREPTRPHRPLRWVVAAVVTLAVLWTPAVVEQLTTQPGNAGQIARHFLDDDRPVAGPAVAADIYGRHLGPAGIWITGDEPTDPFTGEIIPGEAWWAIPAVIAFGLAVVTAKRRRQRDALWLLGIVGTLLAVGLVLTTRTTGEIFPYLYQWLRPLAMLLWLAIAWTAYRRFDAFSTLCRRPWVVGPVVIAGLALAITTSASAVPLELVGPQWSDAVAVVGPPTLEEVEGESALIRPSGECWSEVATGLALYLERGGVDIAVNGEGYRYGEQRVFDGDNATVAVTVACRDEVDDLVASSPGVVLFSRMSPEELDEYAEILTTAEEVLVAGGNDDLVRFVRNGALTLFGDGDTPFDTDFMGRWRYLRELADERIAVLVEPID